MAVVIPNGWEQFPGVMQRVGGDILSAVMKKRELENKAKQEDPTNMLIKLLAREKGLDLDAPSPQEFDATVGQAPAPIAPNQPYQPIMGQQANIPIGLSREMLGVMPAGKIANLVERQAKKRQDVAANIAEIPGAVTKQGALTWNKESTERKIKYDVMEPKLQYLMDAGGRAYKELKTVAKEKLGKDLDFSKGGWKTWEAKIAKMGLNAMSLTPMMKAVKNLGPELGTELMRQLGAFRSGEMADNFRKTLPQFSGDIREDIANFTTTMSKNVANIALVDENGRELSTAQKMAKIYAAEANFIRKYNKIYREWGLLNKPYTMGRSFKELADNSVFNEAEHKIIDNAMEDNKGYSRKTIAAKLIEKGLL